MIQNQVLQVCSLQGLSDFNFLGKVEMMVELEMVGNRGESGGDGLLDSVYLWCGESWVLFRKRGKLYL